MSPLKERAGSPFLCLLFQPGPGGIGHCLPTWVRVISTQPTDAQANVSWKHPHTCTQSCLPSCLGIPRPSHPDAEDGPSRPKCSSMYELPPLWPPLHPVAEPLLTSSAPSGAVAVEFRGEERKSSPFHSRQREGGASLRPSLRRHVYYQKYLNL